MLCIGWGDDALVVAQIGLSKSRPVLQKQWRLQRDSNSPADRDPLQLGLWLEEQWNRNQIPKSAVYVAVPRRQVVLKSFQQSVVQGVPLAETVLLQAESRYPMQMDQLVVDFVQLPSIQSENERIVLTGSIAKPIVNAIETTLDIAGLKLQGVGVGELGLGMLAHETDEHKFELSVLADEVGLEFVASRSGAVFLAQSLRMPLGESERNESIGKLIEHFESKIKDLGFPVPTCVCLYGSHSAAVEAIFASRFPNVIRGAIKERDSIRLQGLASIFNEPSANLNFLNPRKPPDRNANRRKKILRFALVAGAVMVAVSAWVFKIHTDLDKQLAKLNAQHAELRTQLEGTEPTLTAAQQISRWDESRVKWSGELDTLVKQLGSNERCFLKRIQLDSLPESDEVSARLTGLVREKEDALAIADRLVNDLQGYEVAPGPIRPSRQDPYYKSSFDLRISWVKDQEEESRDAQ